MNNELKQFQNDLEECESSSSSVEAALASSSHKFTNNEEFKIKFNQIKSRYNNLINLSGLYAQG